jgi:hypothetical protein
VPPTFLLPAALSPHWVEATNFSIGFYEVAAGTPRVLLNLAMAGQCNAGLPLSLLLPRAVGVPASSLRSCFPLASQQPSDCWRPDRVAGTRGEQSTTPKQLSRIQHGEAKSKDQEPQRLPTRSGEKAW